LKLLHSKQCFLYRDGRKSGFLATFFLYAVLFVASQLLKPKPDIENAKPAGLGEFQFPTATEGRVVPLLWGTVRIDGPNVVWYGDLEQIAITEKIKTSIFSSERIIKGYEYNIGIQFAFCRGEVTSMHGVWIGDDQVFTGTVLDGGTFTIDDRELFGGEELGNGGVVGTFKFFAGTTTQTASSYLSTYQQEGGDTPAYRGTAYIAPDSENVYIGNSTSMKPWKFEVRRIPTGLTLGVGEELVNGADANPANVIYEILTDTDWGLAVSPSDIDTTAMAAVGTVLHGEGNGFSYLLDSPIEASQLLRLLEEQIDGIVFVDQSTGKWTIKLARADYTPGTLTEITVGNSLLESFSRGSWSNTTNIVRVQYNMRDDEYKQTYALAQDTANIRIQGANISATKNYPGVKDATLANAIAWRDLRELSYPLAKIRVTVDRSFWAVQPADVFEYTHEYLGLDRLAMRVTRIDFGELENNKIVLDLVQDVFYTAAGSFGENANTGWGDPIGVLSAFAADEQMAIEAPRALVQRDPAGGTLTGLVLVAAKRAASEALYEIRQRNAVGVPGGAYTPTGTVIQFVKIGELNAAINTKSAYPLTTLDLTSSPNTQAELLAAIATVSDTDELGTDLLNLILVDDEFMLVENATANGALTRLNNVYRGALDSTQKDHSANAEVYILSSGAGLTEDAIPETNQVDIKLIPKAFGKELLEASATVMNFTMDKRIRRPYPPSEVTLNGVVWDTTLVNLESVGSAAEDYGIDMDFTRRDYRVAAGLNEIGQLGVDAETLYPDFPANNTTDHDIEIRHDPSGTDDLVKSYTVSGDTSTILRLEVLQALGGAVPTGDLRVSLTASHTDNGDVLTSRQSLVHDFSIATALSGQFEFGLLGLNVASAVYTATAAGTYNFTLSSAFTAGSVEFRLNSGTWMTLIAATLTTGSIVGVVATDTIEVRHNSVDSAILKQLDMSPPGAGQAAFAVLEN